MEKVSNAFDLIGLFSHHSLFKVIIILTATYEI